MKAVEIMGWITMCLLGAAFGLYTGRHVFPMSTTPAIALSVATYLCANNDGVESIQRQRGSKYQVVCRNTAHFLDVEIKELPKDVHGK